MAASRPAWCGRSTTRTSDVGLVAAAELDRHAVALVLPAQGVQHVGHAADRVAVDVGDEVPGLEAGGLGGGLGLDLADLGGGGVDVGPLHAHAQQAAVQVLALLDYAQDRYLVIDSLPVPVIGFAFLTSTYFAPWFDFDL